MPKQDWNINTEAAYAGEQYGLATTNSQRLTCNTEAEMSSFGIAVVRGSKERTCKPGHAAGVVYGITMRQLNKEAAKRPSDGTVLLPVGTPMGVMLEGAITVKLKTPITDKTIYVNAAGEFGGAGAGFTKAVNVEAIEYPAAAGKVVGVMVIMVPGTAAPASASEQPTAAPAK